MYSRALGTENSSPPFPAVWELWLHMTGAYCHKKYSVIIFSDQGTRLVVFCAGFRTERPGAPGCGGPWSRQINFGRKVIITTLEAVPA